MKKKENLLSLNLFDLLNFCNNRNYFTKNKKDHLPYKLNNTMYKDLQLEFKFDIVIDWTVV